MLRLAVFAAVLAIAFGAAVIAPNLGLRAPRPIVRADDPEEHMSVPEIITYWGYPSQTVPVTTQDGYILQVHRIPYGKSGPGSGKRPVVFMQHGLEGQSSNWVTNLPSESAAFIFADAGYDVWLGNMRGNTYGMGHTTLDPKGHQFWQFSWDEMAKYDLEAMIDTVLKLTGQPSLYYIGHSQGTLTMFSKLATDQTFAPKIKKFFALAPVGTVGHIKGAFYYIAEYLGSTIELLAHVFGEDQFLPSGTIMDTLAAFFCGIFHHSNPLCNNILFLIAGPDSKQLNATRLPVYLGHCPAGTSTQNVVHWVQMVKSNRQQMYDYGSSAANQQHYGNPVPPLYDVSQIRAPVYLYHSDYDWLADSTDVNNHLVPNIKPEYLKGNTQLFEFNHMDFIWGLRAPAEVYQPILTIIDDDSKNSRK
uniref:Lipase n=1 Tax=Plectus sambesii TaxID=2011161 RepID=A0A914WZT1_9BILA